MMSLAGTIRFGKLIDQSFYVQSNQNKKQIYTWQTPERHGASVMGQLHPKNKNAFVANFYNANGKGLSWTRIRLERQPEDHTQTQVMVSMPAISPSSKRYVVKKDGRIISPSKDTEGQLIEMIRDALTLWKRFQSTNQNAGPDTFKKAGGDFPLALSRKGKRKAFFTLGNPLFLNQDHFLIQGQLGPDAYANPDAAFTAEFHGIVAGLPELTVVRLNKNQSESKERQDPEHPKQGPPEQNPDNLTASVSIADEGPFQCDMSALSLQRWRETVTKFILVAVDLRNRVIKATQQNSTDQ